MALFSKTTKTLLAKYGQCFIENLKFKQRLMASSNLYSTTVTSETTSTEPSSHITDNESKLKFDLEMITKEHEILTDRNNDLMDKYKRALAEGENLRIRMIKQVEDAKNFGIQSFCKDLLDVADVLNKATECVPKEEINDKNPHLKNLFEGLVMTQAQLKSVFKRHGLEIFEPLGEKFDPNMHEALFQQDVEGKESGTIVVVSKTGYKLNDRVIRPALVGVAK